jgi:hypothetical protein
VTERDPIGNDARWKRRERELGKGAGCLLCQEGALETLVEASGVFRERLLERHHVVGAANDSKLKVWLCKNCHAKETEAQRVHGIDLNRDTNRNGYAIVEMFLRGIAIFLWHLADRCWAMADLLAAELGASVPGWRDLPSFGH